MTLVVILLVVVFTIAHFHLKCTVMTAFSTFIASIFGSVIAFTYYETLADLFVSRGYGGAWAHSGCFILAYILGLAAVRALADLLVGSNIDFGSNTKMTVNVVLGIFTGWILSGHLLVAMGMLPVQNSWMYNRYSSNTPISIKNPSIPMFNPDGLVSGIYGILSRGSLSSNKSFSVLCADFVNRNHLNRIGVTDSIWTICSRKSLSVPESSKKPVRTMDIPDMGNLTVVRTIIAAKDITDGGAKDDKGEVTFTMSQVRMIIKNSDKAENLKGTGIAIWPIGILQSKKVVRKNLSEKVTYANDDFRKDRSVWVDFVFEVPSDKRGVLLEFKQNALTTLPPPAVSTEEIEAVLNAENAEAKQEPEKKTK